MNKQAILIMVHNNVWTLEKLLKLLDYEYFDIFIHIDKKSDISIENLKDINMENSEVFIYKNIDVRWGDLSMVECEMFLLEKALEINEYKYFHLISGVDMPLKKNKEIFDFFNNSNKEFIHIHHVRENRVDRINNYNILIRYRRMNVALIINRLFVTFQKIFRINRKLNIENFKSGSNWFSITNECAQYLLENKEAILKEFKYSIHSDEFFLQTVVYNSKFFENLYNPSIPNSAQDAMRHIDWGRGTPYVFTINDFQELIDSNCMFARKFDENKDKEIIERLYEMLKD